LKAGLVTAEWKRTGDERPRRYYRATRAGRELLTAFRTQWRPFVAAVEGILEEDDER
jgi:DNA-binding PadR family transcriptional regulator